MTHKFTCSLLACLALAGIANAQKSGDAKADETFISPDGTFRIQYSAPLVKCSRSSQPGLWIPSEFCSGYIPVCVDTLDDPTETVVCIGYGAEEDKNGTNLQAATLSVSQPHRATELECLKAEIPAESGPARRETINGIKFQVTAFDGVAAGNLAHGYTYRSFHKGKCYELDIKIGETNIGNYDPGTVKPFDSDKVERALKRALYSFKFLK